MATQGDAGAPAQAASPAERLYRDLLEDANDVIYTHDLRGCFTSINRAVTRVYGYQPDELIGRSIAELVDKQWLPIAQENMRRKVAGEAERTPPYELLTRAKDGREVWVEVSTRILRAGGADAGPPVAVQGIARDVTDRHARQVAEQRLRERDHEEVERLAELERYKSDFLRIAAHELGNPLTSLRIQLQILGASADLHRLAKEAHALEVVDRNVKRLLRLVDDLGQAARLQSGHLELKPKPLDVVQVVRDVADTFQGVAAGKGMRVQVHAPETARAVADPERLAQVVSNLVANAIKYSDPGGGVQVDVQVPEGGGVRVHVADQGIGFSEEGARLLFQPFMRIHDVMLRSDRPGTGLGLYICRGIVEQHGGAIGCTSPGPGRGATFWFHLPDAPDASQTAAASERTLVH